MKQERSSKRCDTSLCGPKKKKIYRDYVNQLLKDRGIVTWSHRRMKVSEKEFMILVLCNLLDPEDPHRAFRAVLAQLTRLLKGLPGKFRYQDTVIPYPEERGDEAT